MAAYSKPTVKVLVVGNPANTNAMIAAKFASPKIPAKNITAMTRLDQNRTMHQIAAKHGVSVDSVKRVTIWGNHSSTQFPDISQVTVAGEKVKFENHCENFIEMIQKRGAAVIAARKLSSAMSAAKAAADHMHDWWKGTSSDWISMGVISDGNSYGIPDGLMFSFPVTISDQKEWKIVDGIEWNEFAKDRIKVTTDELLEERNEALAATEN